MNRRTGIILLIGIAVLGAIAYYLNLNPEIGSNPTPTPPPSAEQSPLWTIDSSQVQSLTVTDAAKQLTFSATVDEAGKWMLTQPQQAEADPTTMSTVINTLTTLYVNRTITDNLNLAEFGLDLPNYAIAVKLKDGQTFKATVGKKAVSGYAYYVLADGASSPVLISSFSLDTLLTLPGKPPLVTPTARVTLEPLPTFPNTGTPSP